MTIEIKRNADVVTVEPSGRLDTTTAPALEKTLSVDLADATNIVLDLKSLEYVSSAGLRVFLGAQKRMMKVGSLRLINVNADIMEIFEITGFVDILTIG